MPQPTRSLGKAALTVNYRHPSCSETEGASCHSSPVDELVRGTYNYQWLPWSSAQILRPWLSLPTMLPGLLNIKHLFVLEAQLLLSLQLSLCTPLCMPVRDCLPGYRCAHLGKCFKMSYSMQAGAHTYVFINTLRQHSPDFLSNRCMKAGGSFKTGNQTKNRETKWKTSMVLALICMCLTPISPPLEH